MASAATGGDRVHLQLADECAAVHGLHDGGFRHCMRLKIQEPDSSSALQLVAGPLSCWRNGSADCGRGPEPALRSEEHTSELQSRENLVCRLLLEKKKNLLLRHPSATPWQS